MGTIVFPLQHNGYTGSKSLLNTITVETIGGKEYLRCKDIFYYSQRLVQNIESKELQILMYKLTYFVCTQVECTELNEEKHILVTDIMDAIEEFKINNNKNKGFINLCNIILNELELVSVYNDE